MTQAVFDRKQFRVFNDSRSLLLLIGERGIIITTIIVSQYYATIRGYVIAVRIIGSRQSSLRDKIGHDAIHYNLFSRKKRNKRVERCCYLPMFETRQSYHDEHIAHHQHTNDPDNDPQISRYYQQRGLRKKNINRLYTWWIKPLIPFNIIGEIREIISLVQSNKQARKKILLFRLGIMLISVATGMRTIVIFYRLVPFFWSRVAFDFWSDVSDHFGSITGTRTLRGRWFTLFVKPHNDIYHALHHHYPAIPNSQLKHARNEYKKIYPTIKQQNFIEVFQEIKEKQIK